MMSIFLIPKDISCTQKEISRQWKPLSMYFKQKEVILVLSTLNLF